MAAAGGGILGLVALTALSLYVARKTAPQPGDVSKNRIGLIIAQIEDQEKDLARDVTSYTPKTTARIDDLTVSAKSILGQSMRP